MATQNAINLKVTNNADGFDISGGTTARKLTVTTADITLTASMAYALHFTKNTGDNPLDITAYYIAYDDSFFTTSTITRVWVPLSGTITSIYGHFYHGTVGTSENSTLKLRKNDSNIYTISTTLDHSTAVTTFSATGINQAVVAGDWLDLEWTTPAWITNPLQVRIFSTVYIEF